MLATFSKTRSEDTLYGREAISNGAHVASTDAISMARKVIAENEIEYLRFTYVCNDGVIRSKTRYLGPHSSNEPLPAYVGLSFAEQLVTAIDDRIVDQAPFDSVGEVRLSPDWGSLRPIPQVRRHGRVFGPITDGSGLAWANCPRSFLHRVNDRAARSRLKFRIAFENEFYLLQINGSKLKPIDTAVYAQDDAFSRVAGFMDNAVQSLVSSNITPITLHPESGPGQFEISISPSDPLKAADDQVILRSTIKDLATNSGMLATFLPRPLDGGSSSGSHINISLWEEGVNITGNGDRLSDVAGSFVAGILDHLPALVAITCPTVNSYHRLRPGMWSGAYRCWGRANREAAIRVPYCIGGNVTHIEYRCADATCNPYLALGAILSSGLDGIDRCLELPSEAAKDLLRLNSRELRREGVSVLPQKLDIALQHLSDDNNLRGDLGYDLHKSYLAVHREEFRRLRRGVKGEALYLLARRF